MCWLVAITPRAVAHLDVIDPDWRTRCFTASASSVSPEPSQKPADGPSSALQASSSSPGFTTSSTETSEARCQNGKTAQNSVDKTPAPPIYCVRARQYLLCFICSPQPVGQAQRSAKMETDPAPPRQTTAAQAGLQEPRMGQQVRLAECGFWGGLVGQLVPPIIIRILERVAEMVLDGLARLLKPRPPASPPATPSATEPAASGAPA